MITQCLRSNDPNCLFILSATLHWIPQLPLIWDNTRITPVHTQPLVTQTVSSNQLEEWPGQSGQTCPHGTRQREREMDVHYMKFMEGDSQGWPLESTEALARVPIVHWDNTLTPWRAFGLQGNVPGQPQHIAQGAVGGSSDKLSIPWYTIWRECAFSGCCWEVWGY